jgi:hypothetical protein
MTFGPLPSVRVPYYTDSAADGSAFYEPHPAVRHSLRSTPRPRGERMATLHIEHPISDLDTWLGAFNNFAEARKNAGVRAQQVRQPVGDPRYIVVDLEFDDSEAATGFKEFLEGVVWQSKDLSPGLDGVPTARVLDDVDPGRLH